MSDQELAARYRNGEEGACTALLARYASLINRWIGSWGIPGADREDLRQEACMGLLNAIRTYDPAKNTCFEAYASRCVGNRVKNLLAAASTHKARARNHTLSIDDLREMEGHGDNPETILLDKEALARLREVIDTALSPLEKDVLFAYLGGHSYQETALMLGSPQKSVDKALQRVRRKLKTVLNQISPPGGGGR